MGSRVVCLYVALVATPVAAVEFFVAPGGNDASPGTQAKPFATIARAQKAVAGRIVNGVHENITVWIRGGTYRIAAPIVFGPPDSGAPGVTVTYAAKPGEAPVVSGGRVIGGWKARDDGTWVAEIPEAKGGAWTFRQLYVNGRRATRARHPNEGFLRVEKVGADRRTHFQYRAGDFPRVGDLAGLELVFLHDWSITRCPVKTIDEKTRTLTVPRQIGGNSRWAVMDWFEKKPRYFLENARAFLDAPGEWHLDRKTGVLAYRPRDGETIDAVQVVAPVADQLLVVRGDVEGEEPVRNLRFVGIAFEHAAWAPPDDTYWGRQACTYWAAHTEGSGRSHEEADPAAVQFIGTESCRFERGRIAHVGASGIWLGRGCRGNQIIGSQISDVGGNGIMIGEGQVRTVGGEPWWSAAPTQAARGNGVANCLIEDCGLELYGAVGIWVGLAAHTTILRNEIRRTPYTGVSVGWMWWNPRSRPEPRKTPCTNNVVARNHIHDVMQILSDGGGIYTLGTQPGSVLRENLIHAVRPNAGRAESNGMFLDQGTGEFTIEGNVIYDIARSPLRFHKGWKNLVVNNVMAVASGIPTVRYNDTKEERIRIENNTVVEPGAAALEAAIERLRPQVGPEPAYRRLFAGWEAD